ncbi:aldo/keto reductase [Sphingomonas sp. BAUL-RG-20F-R05-02]|uniref:aldo/keto reductase n=1 Tax=Sphingomonas sp. BAUL-RG-20F-R05-02 TaxID=2914830 RepID=UPI001F574377|nr:aldo/keto reductase [Sphingomonas sp. BAUL-RG-20F-R05-02]
MQTRPLGHRTVTAISLGCMNLSHAYDVAPPEAEASALLNRALDLGVTMLDTAALYGGGENEKLLSRTVMHRRGEFTLASKCVLDMPGGKRVLDGSPAAITASIDRSLARLGTDHIDLMYLHRLDPNVGVEDSVGALARAIEAGKIGMVGLSEMSAATIRRAHAVHPVAAVQSEYSPMVRNPEVAVLETCRELNVAFVAFSPVARGMLAGAIRTDTYKPGDIRATMPRFIGADLRTNLDLVARFDAVAANAGLTPAQLALGWVLSRGDHVIALPGTRSIAHIEEDVATLDTPVPAAALAAVDAMFPIHAIAGPRYTAAMQAMIDTELLPGEVLA